jgi:stearoyl-CoA desaturase (delta-9 desaturase)
MAEADNKETLAKYGHGTPNDWLERKLYSRFTWHGCGIMVGLDLILFGWAGLAVWGVQMMWIPFFAAGVINGIGHFWGYRNFDAPDASTNISPWGILIGGEELHNNHHTYPTSAKLSSKWFEFDIGWLYIRLMDMVGLARVLRVAPVPRELEAPRAGVDFDTLQAVIAYRYDLLARYTRDLRRAYAQELAQMRLSTADQHRFAALRRWLRKGDVASLPAAQQQTLRELLGQNRAIRTMIEMRTELLATWDRSSASREQMLAHLQDWIARAESSGIQALQNAAVRIRSYAPATAVAPTAA